MQIIFPSEPKTLQRSPRRSVRIGAGSLLVLLVSTLAVGLDSIRVFADEGTWNQAGGGDWNSGANWSGAVPTTGDTALFDTLPGADVTIQINGPTSVGTLRSTNPNVLLFSGDTLSFNSGTPGVDATLEIPGALGSLQFDANLDLQSALVVGDVESTRDVLFNGQLLSGSNSLTLAGGNLNLAGDNSAWSGEVILNAGKLTLDHTSGLGDTTGQTTVNGGQLWLKVPTSETLSLNGGSIIFLTSDHSNPIASTGGSMNMVTSTLSGAVQLSGGTTQISGSFFAMNGGSTGNGFLDLVGGRGSYDINQPLTHTGTTSLRNNITLNLGGAVFQNHDLILDTGTTTIANTVTESVQAGNVLMRGNSTLTRAPGIDPAVSFSFDGQFTYESGVIDLPLQGSGDVVLNNTQPLTLDREHSYSGKTFINNGNIVLDHPNGLGNSVGETVLANGTTLGINVSTPEPFDLNDSQIQLMDRNLTLSGEIALQGNGRILLEEDVPGSLSLTNTISGPGSLSISGYRRQTVNLSGNNTYHGLTTLSGDHPTNHTKFVAHSASAFGDDSQGTSLISAELTLMAPSTEPIHVDENSSLRVSSVAESFHGTATLNGGLITLDGEVVSSAQIIAGPLGGEMRLHSDTNWSGSVTGTGDMIIFGSNQVPLNGTIDHTGNLSIGNVQLDLANSYVGKTTITSNTIVNHPQALGAGDESVLVNGLLILNVVPDKEFEVQDGLLDIQTSVTPVTRTITLNGSDYFHYASPKAVIQGDGVFNGTIIAAGLDNNHIRGGTFNGTIQGPGNVILEGPISLNSANAMKGQVRIAGNDNYPTNMNHPDALSLNSTLVSDGNLHLNVPIDEPIVQRAGKITFNHSQDFAFPWGTSSGFLDASTEIGFSKLLLLNRGHIDVESGGTIRIDEELRVLGETTIYDGLSGTGDIKLQGRSLRFGYAGQGDLSGHVGNIYVESGYLNFNISDRARTPKGDIHAMDRVSALLQIGNLDSDVYLHRSKYISFDEGETGIVTNGKFYGDIYLSDTGSAIESGASYRGQFIGSDLTLTNYGNDSTAIQAPQNELTGNLTIQSELTVYVNGPGQLNSLDSITLRTGGKLSIDNSDSLLHEENGEIYVDPNNPSGPNLDRIADSTTIKSFGGEIVHIARETALEETLGELTLERGYTLVQSLSNLNGALILTQLTRRPSASVAFYVDHGDVKITNPPPLLHGMLGPWATTARNYPYPDTGFATLAGDGSLVKLEHTSTDLSSANSTDHVLISGSQTLESATTIASLQMSADSPLEIDLAGNEFSVLSGGLLSISGYHNVDIINGRLTSGTNESSELVLSSTAATISADIVDNSPQGSVALVLNRSGVHLSGNNTYTGGTWVVGKVDREKPTNSVLYIDTPSAVPADDQVYVDSGIYDIQLDDTNTILLSELHLRGKGEVRSEGAAVEATHYFLEEGDMLAPLRGNGTILKSTHGTARITSKSPDFNGAISVNEGILYITSDPHSDALGSNAEIIVNGGQLQVGGPLATDIVLNGGTLRGEYTGSVQITDDSYLRHSFNGRGAELSGDLSGNSRITVVGPSSESLQLGYYSYVSISGDASQFHGDIYLESGTLQASQPESIGTGKITVASGARLAVGRFHFGTFTPPDAAIANDIHLHGGILFGNKENSSVTGDVTVHEDAFIGGYENHALNITGNLILTDGAEVYGYSQSLNDYPLPDETNVEVSGTLLVGSNASWNLQFTSIALTGTIQSNSQNASIDFIGLARLAQKHEASIQIEPGQSLSILINGEAQPFEMNGNGNAIQGNGTFGGDISVSGGAAISPGNSAGLLTIDGDATIGAGGHFVVELGGTLRGDQYDALDVTGDALLSGLLDVSFIEGFTPLPEHEFVILQANQIDGMFANAGESIAVGDYLLSVSYFSDRIVLGNATTIPEPTTALLFALGLALLSCGRTRKIR